MKIIFVTLLLFISLKLSAQQDNLQFVNDTSKKAEENFLASVPMEDCYSSDKVKKLVPVSEKKYRPAKIKEADFKTLTAYEHFVYAFYSPEWYFQSCYMFPTPTHILGKIPAHLKRQGEGLTMGKRQMQALIVHRDSVIILLQQCIEKQRKIDDDFKRVIAKLRAFELIPTLINVLEQSDVKDPYIVTLLCLLMRFEFDPFIGSDIHKHFYPSEPDDAYYFSGERYKKAIPFTTDNYNKIVKWAEAYYQLKSNEPSYYVKIPKGLYQLGEKDHSVNPQREIEQYAFEISRYEVTNKQFKLFVDQTDYVTMAEKHKDAFVFRLGLDEFEWTQDSTANWRYPNGISKGGIDDKMDHPVTCISYIDALAYCEWRRVRLPTIEEWEIASRGNTSNARHYFGDSLNLIYQNANVWHGKTHLMKYESEDYLTTSPVGSFEPNQYGIHDIYGNVFEFCANIPEAFKDYKNIAATRGGSWWCSKYACAFFNSIDIGRVQKEASFSNNGFRVVR